MPNCTAYYRVRIVLEKLSELLTKPVTMLGLVDENHRALDVLLLVRPWHGKELESKAGERREEKEKCCFYLHVDQSLAQKLAETHISECGDAGNLSLCFLLEVGDCLFSATGHVQFLPLLPPHVLQSVFCSRVTLQDLALELAGTKPFFSIKPPCNEGDCSAPAMVPRLLMTSTIEHIIKGVDPALSPLKSCQNCIAALTEVFPHWGTSSISLFQWLSKTEGKNNMR